MKPRFLRMSYLFWTIVPVLAALFYLAFGLPHVIWSYDWLDNGTYDPLVSRHYVRCTFIGPYGAFTTYPGNGRCGWLRFYKQRKDK